jgi:hypothetical protein
MAMEARKVERGRTEYELYYEWNTSSRAGRVQDSTPVKDDGTRNQARRPTATRSAFRSSTMKTVQDISAAPPVASAELALLKSMRLRATLTLLAILITAPITADVTARPPVTKETFVGVWEALFPDAHHLLHMEINSRGDSYLCWAVVRWTTSNEECSCWRLLNFEIKDGVVKLHFGDGFSNKSEAAIRELWMIGTGDAIDVQGELDAQFCGNSWPDTPPTPATSFGVVEFPSAGHIFFRKQTWARDLASAAQTAEQMIADARANKP